MPIVGGMNDDYVQYFPLEEYVDRIRLQSYVLEHLEDTNNNFKEYIKKIMQRSNKYIVDYWIYLLYEELKSSHKIENIDFQKIDLLNDQIFFGRSAITHNRIHELHNFALDGIEEPTFSYRSSEVDVSRVNDYTGEKEIFWRGAQAKDVEKFMNDFLKIYKKVDISLIMSNPFLKSALIHLLFVRIHPYSDGNGRTARLLHNAKFTDSINRIYGTRLKISPLNLSQSFLVNKYSYVNAINNIYFDIKHDSNEAINKWFNMILNMVDEQTYFASNKLDCIDESFLKQLEEEPVPNLETETNKMRIRGLNR